MNLGQMMMVIVALAMLGMLMLNANNTVLETNDTQNASEFGITAVSLATSIVEEASGKMFDEVIADSTTSVLSAATQLTAVTALGKDGSETYRSSTLDFNDYDDFHGLSLVFKSPLDSAVTPGVTREFVVPGIRAKYLVRCRVEYVADTDLDCAVNYRTWHKRLTVTVTAPGNPVMRDSLVYPTVVSYWN
jgi:hypothetical protein